MRLGRLVPILCLAAAAAVGCGPQGAKRAAPGGSVEAQPRAASAAEEVVALPPAVALERARAALAALGFSVSPLAGRAGAVEATSGGGGGPAPAGWATCPPLTLRDPFAEALRRSRVEAGPVSTRVTVGAAPDGAGSRVSVRALHLATYVNPFTGTPQEGACRSTGLLERELLDAVRSGGGGPVSPAA